MHMLALEQGPRSKEESRGQMQPERWAVRGRLTNKSIRPRDMKFISRFALCFIIPAIFALLFCPLGLRVLQL